MYIWYIYLEPISYVVQVYLMNITCVSLVSQVLLSGIPCTSQGFLVSNPSQVYFACAYEVYVIYFKYIPFIAYLRYISCVLYFNFR